MAKTLAQKSKAAISQARKDPRYIRYREQREREILLIAAQDAADPEASKAHRRDLRADIAAAFDTAQRKDGE
ncbi:hypothetical protein EOD42_07540 [Rhodovarius crocodyli]|uniref:Uncharacterized protein n=1 Tax=Rhodovarius crocodyli TaxID=1979269 RepID=A0A437MJ55_9PROT|nr:hypothetical protein [Rhodovarius crocodyli]RVT97661.1 hypothetical protein EOD42_07540 [Rhodovarius crocodyli]